MMQFFFNNPHNKISHGSLYQPERTEIKSISVLADDTVSGQPWLNYFFKKYKKKKISKGRIKKKAPSWVQRAPAP